jgi:hypothetical protein
LRLYFDINKSKTVKKAKSIVFLFVQNKKRGAEAPLNVLAQELNLGNMQPFGCLATDAIINPLQR